MLSIEGVGCLVCVWVFEGVGCVRMITREAACAHCADKGRITLVTYACTRNIDGRVRRTTREVGAQTKKNNML